MDSASKKKPFAALWVEVQQPVATFIAAAGPGFHDTDDLLQKVAVIAFEKFDTFDPDCGPFLAWVIGIAKNELLHWRRGLSRDRHVFQPEVLECLADAQRQEAGEPSLAGQAVAWCLDKVRGRAREILSLRYVDDLKPAEIADRLGTSSSSIRVTLTRTRGSLRECVERRIRAMEGDAP